MPFAGAEANLHTQAVHTSGLNDWLLEQNKDVNKLTDL